MLLLIEWILTRQSYLLDLPPIFVQISLFRTTAKAIVNLIHRMWRDFKNEVNDFDLYVYDSNRRLIRYSNTAERQEVVSFVPRTTGTYLIEVYSYRGKGTYYLDISGEGAD
jgi:serine protease AprX